MSWWSRVANVFRADRVAHEIDEELQAHIDEAVDQGRDPAEAHRSLGPALRLREESRDLRVVAWLDSLRADAVFGWRQLMKNKVASMAALLSLALGIGACTGAFRLIDALLLRPLPVTEPDRLYVLARQGIDPGGHFRTTDSTEYPTFQIERAAVKDQAELIAVSYADRADLTYGSDEEMEKAHRQFVSGWMFESFGLRPTLGRLLATDDDLKPHAHAYAVLSYDYWKSRFGRDPKIVGRTFRMGNDLYEIVGVGPEGFTGTEPGTAIDIFLPTMMSPGVTHADWSWFRTFVKLKAGVAVGPVRDKLAAINHAVEAAYYPFQAVGDKGVLQPIERATFIVRTAASNPLTLASTLRREIPQARPEFRVSNIRTQSEIDQSHTVRERLLSGLAFFFGIVALVLAGVGLYGVLDYSVLQRRREVAIRMALGAQAEEVARRVTADVFTMVLAGAVAGLAFGFGSARYVESLLYEVKPTDPRMIVLPALTILIAALVAAIPPVLRAVRIDPAMMLRAE